MTANNATILSVSDLNTTINHEPRILDLTVAARLGYERPTDIRELIARNEGELSTYGEVFRAARKTPSAKGGRPSEDIYLNEGQALVICALSRTPKAAAVRKAIIEEVGTKHDNAGQWVLPGSPPGAGGNDLDVAADVAHQ